MITALDTNVLLDVLLEDPVHLHDSPRAINRCAREGNLVVCDVILAELTAVAASIDTVEEVLIKLGVQYVPLEQSAAIKAGEYWRNYRLSGGPRTRVLADFLVAAHANVHADQLLTRDFGFYRQHFAGLRVLNPSNG